MEKMDKIQCKYIEDYPDIQKSSIHISSETKKYLDGADQLNNRYGIKIPSYLRDKLVKGEQYEIKDEII